MAKGRFTITAGLIYRRQVRRALMQIGVNFIEDKGLFDSLFIINDEVEMVTKAYRWMKDVEAKGSYK